MPSRFKDHCDWNHSDAPDVIHSMVQSSGFEEFTALVMAHVQAVAAYARRLCDSTWEADDLVQDTYEAAFRRWSELRDPAKCRGWLFRIARNRHIDLSRAKRVRNELFLVDPDPAGASASSVPIETVEQLTADELESALSRLPVEQREALLLCDLWGFRYDEIAVIAGVPIGTVRSRIARGRTSMIDALGGRVSRQAGAKEA